MIQSFTEDQVIYIIKAAKTNQELAKELNCSVVTISKVRNFRGAYKKYEDSVWAIGTPVLNAHGQIIGVQERD